ncbi:sigma-70 family RNA polymerase sigma factor [Comamonas sediminis]|uniref:Sigma-70 family RNA polymerase sigma factor n=1 Tax=Comamonas sediminis TaxID=1783360 RepID=A0ABV4B1Y8_9BURK
MATDALQFNQSGSMAGEDASHLWQQWQVTRSDAVHKALAAHYLPYAKTLAAMAYRGRFHDEVEFDDYFQFASIGLLEALQRFEPQHGAQFKTYAAHRIKGAILNGLEKLTEKNQQIAAQKRLRQERLEAIKAQAQEATGSTAQPGTAKSQQTALLAYLAEVGIGLALGIMLEDTGMLADPSDQTASLAASPDIAYFRKSEIQRWKDLLREALNRLPAQEKRVISYHYQQEIAFDQIGAMMGVSRSRISQLHRQGLKNLRSILAHGPPCDVSW